MRMRSSYNPSVAIVARKNAALAAAGGRDAVAQRLYDAALAIITRDGRTPLAEVGIEDLRAAGGFSHILDRALGNQPDGGEVNEAGMPESDEYWLWLATRDLHEEVRFALQRDIYNAGRGA